ncbi:hypothetical protein ACFL6C_04560 [Myxococcota bacterium]
MSIQTIMLALIVVVLAGQLVLDLQVRDRLDQMVAEFKKKG